MFTTGIPQLSLAFFSAASMAVAIPSGIQVFAWTATIAAARRVQFKVPMLFVLGFLFIFVLGGLTRVMVASVPFDWQVHDTYLVVAHLHYVLFGITKRGDTYLRTLLIHGARSALRCAGDKPDKLLRWAHKLAERRGVNVAAVALANKMARVIWALLAHGREYVPVRSKSMTRPA